MAEIPSQLSRAWYRATLSDFARADPNAVIGQLVMASGHSVEETQAKAWIEQIQFLWTRLAGLQGTILFEFDIPRMGQRIDVVLLIGHVILVVEFKVGATSFSATAIEQVWDYALDLKNFHAASHHLPIAPIVVATEARDVPSLSLNIDSDGVYRPVCATPGTFRDVLNMVVAREPGPAIDVDAWLDAPYQPTPTIIEAARALYSRHSVEAISRHDAGAENLRVTSVHIEDIIAEAKRYKQKVICFVTGVPGAGKTLVGLNVATRSHDEEAGSPAVYLSGNDPLVKVLREALARDEVARQEAAGRRMRIGRARGTVKQFIQNVHHFRDEMIRSKAAPAEHVALFDEAQRAWNLSKTVRFMKQRKGIPDFKLSEPEFLISSIDRHLDWGVVVCLVGGGQEIHDGEGGIGLWLDAIRSQFLGWRMHISSRLLESEYAALDVIQSLRSRPDTYFDDSLHLAVSMRSFRAEHLSTFVKQLLDREEDNARLLLSKIVDRYPIVVTRNLDVAKDWVRSKARGSERFGLLASSNAFRLKPHAIDVRDKVDPVYWFLNDKKDVRSSYYLEDAATEFDVQGLELDWACVTWDADLRVSGRGWSYHDFIGTRWTNVRNADNRRYLLNAYRVLLTRARQGMAIFVPHGHANDATRDPSDYNHIYEYLTSLGVVSLP